MPALERLLQECGILQRDEAAAQQHPDACVRYDSATYDKIWGEYCLCWQPPGRSYVVCSCWAYAWHGHCCHCYTTEAWFQLTCPVYLFLLAKQPGRNCDWQAGARFLARKTRNLVQKRAPILDLWLGAPSMCICMNAALPIVV